MRELVEHDLLAIGAGDRRSGRVCLDGLLDGGVFVCCAGPDAAEGDNAGDGGHD
jgi:hypothetical protein